MVINERVLHTRVAESRFALSRADQRQEIKQSLAVAFETLNSLLLEQKAPDNPGRGCWRPSISIKRNSTLMPTC